MTLSVNSDPKPGGGIAKSSSNPMDPIATCNIGQGNCSLAVVTVDVDVVTVEVVADSATLMFSG